MDQWPTVCALFLFVLIHGIQSRQILLLSHTSLGSISPRPLCPLSEAVRPKSRSPLSPLSRLRSCSALSSDFGIDNLSFKYGGVTAAAKFSLVCRRRKGGVCAASGFKRGAPFADFFRRELRAERPRRAFGEAQ